MTRAPSSLTVTLLVAVLCLIWSSTWWAIRQSLLDLPPLHAAAARFCLAAVVMAAIARLLGAREGGARPPFWLVGTVATTNFALSYGVLYATETVVPSGVAAVLWAVFPVLMAIGGHWFLAERVRPRQALGFAVAFVGTVVMFCGDLGGDRQAILGPALLLLGSPLVSAIGTLLLKRHGGGTSSLLLNRDAMALGALQLVLAASAFERDQVATWSPRALVATVYLAVVGTAMAFGLYFWLLRWAQASRLSLISYVTPCLALLLGWVVGDGDLDAPTVLGCALTAAGIALVVERHRE